jgi:FlaA1/EpsC-like NDP-sugar epimerase
MIRTLNLTMMLLKLVYQRLIKLARPLAMAPRPFRQALAAVLDVLGVAVALWLALALRFGSLPVGWGDFLSILFTALVAGGSLFVVGRLYRSLIRAMVPSGFFVIGIGMLVSGAAIAVIEAVPWDVAASFSAFGTLLLGLVRLLIRSLVVGAASLASQPIVIYGAGDSGRRLAAALFGSRDLRPVAFVDDSSILRHADIGGLRVYAPAELPRLLSRQEVNSVVLAMPSVGRSRRREILRSLSELGVTVRTLPDIDDLVSGKANVEDLRSIDITDVLGRDAVEARTDLLSARISGQSVMVTGAGGSIGSELCRQIILNRPRRLVLFELSEASLYQIDAEMRQRIAELDYPTEIVAVLGDVRDTNRFEATLKAFQVKTIYHASAYKHVPIVEENVLEGLSNNVFGTLSAATAASRSGVEFFILISTDKAVNPTNVMGASKRLAELVLQALQQEHRRITYSMVRFGNVLGSSGSVVPLFESQIRKGGPVTVTHPDITRYFMTIPEAAQLVIQAGSMAKGGEVFVLDMGAPVRIADLARKMIELAGFRVKEPDSSSEGIEIAFTGLRPGEKLYEELLIGNNVSGTDHPMIMRAAEHALPWSELSELLDKMRALITDLEAGAAVSLLKKCVREFTPASETHDLLHRAAVRKVNPPVRLVGGTGIEPVTPAV